MSEEVSIGGRLTETQRELADTQRELAETRAGLAKAQGELAETTSVGKQVGKQVGGTLATTEEQLVEGGAAAALVEKLAAGTEQVAGGSARATRAAKPADAAEVAVDTLAIGGPHPDAHGDTGAALMGQKPADAEESPGSWLRGAGRTEPADAQGDTGAALIDQKPADAADSAVGARGEKLPTTEKELIEQLLGEAGGRDAAGNVDRAALYAKADSVACLIRAVMLCPPADDRQCLDIPHVPDTAAALDCFARLASTEAGAADYARHRESANKKVLHLCHTMAEEYKSEVWELGPDDWLVALDAVASLVATEVDGQPLCDKDDYSIHVRPCSLAPPHVVLICSWSQ